MTNPAPKADTARTRARGPAQRMSAISIEAGSASTADLVALALALIWIIGVGAFLMFAGGDNAGGIDAPGVIISLLVLFVPPILIWIAAVTVRSSRALRADIAQLRQTVLLMGSGQTDPAPVSAPAPQAGQGHVEARSVEARLDDLARAQKQTEVALTTFFSTRPGASPVAAPAAASDPMLGQAVLALDGPAQAPSEPLSNADFVTALNFPKTPDDAEGFRALRRALKDRRTGEVIQAAEDVLTLLSQDGIYMDDLTPDRARPEVWRKFGSGDRGRTIAALGGVRDRSSLALSAGRMKQDPVFRDAVHHFLRRFDQAFTDFADRASDAEIAALADTRTARAFMLLGRVTGTFD